jgi:hypothetical protein
MNYIAQRGDSVGHDSIYAKVEKTGHLDRVVDGPHVHLQPCSMSPFDER